ncbi:unnamed protein product, partial [Adineta steineri]
MQFTRISVNSYRPRVTRVRPSDVPSTYRSSNNSNPAFASHIRPPYQQQSRLQPQQQQQLQQRPLQPRQQVSLPAPLQRHRLVQHQQQVQRHPLQPRQQVLQQAVQLRQLVLQPVRPQRQVLQPQVLRHPRVQHQRQRQRQVLQLQHQRQQRQQVTPACGTYPSSPPGQILSNFPKGAAKTVFPLTTYTQYTSTFTASSTLATLSFIILGEGGGGAVHYWLIDDVVANHTNANANVLINGDFETGNLNGWTQYCNTTTNCDAGSTGNYGHTVPTGSGPCYSGSYCVFDSCKNTDYLEQSFSTVIGDYYIISYYIRNGNNNDAGPLA